MTTHRRPQQPRGQLLHPSPLGAVRRKYDVVVKVETVAYTVEFRTPGKERVSDNEGLT